MPSSSLPQAPLTTQTSTEFRGPNSSEEYNKRIENNYKDLTILYNRVNLSEQENVEVYSRFYKDELNIMQILSNLEHRITALELDQTVLTFSDFDAVDTLRFNNTSFAIAASSQLSQDNLHGLLTLPQIPSATVSKLAFTDPASGQTILPSSLATAVQGINSSADDSSINTINTSPPELAIVRQVGRIWQRNVISSAPNSSGAQLALYIGCPQNIFTTPNANTIFLHPFPALGTDILEIAYATLFSPALNDSDGYQTFPQVHVDDPNAVGWVPPGTFGDGSDVDLNAGFKAYYFDPIPITALRIKLRQRNYYQENSQTIYSYGASLIDLRQTKFISSGSIIIKLNAPQGKTISNVTNVEPFIYNVIESELPEVFSYQIIWETGYNSGNYTLSPVPFSQRVWIQVNLSATANSGSPALSGLSIQFS